ncbi:MAG: hypothetical protein NZM13_06765 [Cyclobacteriaceae bacterium]|nr:hypothetical protein [Cyclobacteriaceae bacterium]MDW8331594.1 hypothetical protein [Cyclobacteriaceae bacterium]
MKGLNIIPLIILISIFSNPVSAQKNGQGIRTRKEIIRYLDKNKDRLDPIEGIWSLNVINSLYDKRGNVVKQSYDENRSSWAIVRVDKLRYKVVDIGEDAPDSHGFDAYFESTALPGIYTYKCIFKKPDWVANANAKLEGDVALRYDYFVSKKFMKREQKYYYKRGMWLHWDFFWVKKYPQEIKRIEKSDPAKSM